MVWTTFHSHFSYLHRFRARLPRISAPYITTWKQIAHEDDDGKRGGMKKKWNKFRLQWLLKAHFGMWKLEREEEDEKVNVARGEKASKWIGGKLWNDEDFHAKCLFSYDA